MGNGGADVEGRCAEKGIGDLRGGGVRYMGLIQRENLELSFSVTEWGRGYTVIRRCFDCLLDNVLLMFSRKARKIPDGKRHALLKHFSFHIFKNYDLRTSSGAGLF